MDINKLQVDTGIVGGYFSSEQIDLLSIIQCNDINALIDFILHCDQINNRYTEKDLAKLSTTPLDTAQRKVFQDYQDSLVSHNASRELIIQNKLNRCGIAAENLAVETLPQTTSHFKELIQQQYPDQAEVIFDLCHHFVSVESNQIKDANTYHEMTFLNQHLNTFNTILIGSGKIYKVVNDFYSSDRPDKRFDFYHTKRDLDFAYRNSKQVRYHALLVKDGMDGLFAGKSKEQIITTIKDYVKATIDFINTYNQSHRLKINGQDAPLINAVDLFNEIVSFDKNANGEYDYVWESKYQITLDELLPAFDYALQHKPAQVNFLYNEPFLEDEERRKKVLATLAKIDMKRPGLIDTLGSQMHITVTPNENKIKRCFDDFKKLQSTTGKRIQITEFDMSLSKTQIPRLFGEHPDVTLEQVYAYKHKKIADISHIIQKSGVQLDGISYWSLTDGIDSNLERIRTNCLLNGSITDIHQVPTACGGLFSTHKNLIKQQIFVAKQNPNYSLQY
ncbi:MAG: endo-1,4-beta-xylanase [Clostridia bacterium]|nr:endo-1,4-beta-xylanase [Clostridia bacterium]